MSFEDADTRMDKLTEGILMNLDNCLNTREKIQKKDICTISNSIWEAELAHLAFAYVYSEPHLKEQENRVFKKHYRTIILKIIDGEFDDIELDMI